MKGEPLELWEGTQECLRCGHCCRIRSCGFGEWDSENHKCVELRELQDGTFACAKYQEIIDGNDITWRMAPAFGAGCCSSFNPDRIALLQKQRKEGRR